MAQYWLDLGLPDGDILNQFTVLSETPAEAELRVLTDNSRRAIELYAGNTGSPTAFALWNTAGQNSGVTQILLEMRANTENSWPKGSGLRLQSGAVSGYSSMDRISSSNTQIIGRYNAGAAAYIAQGNGTYSTGNTVHWRLFEVSGTTVRHMAWEGDPVLNRPADWQQTTTDSTYSTGFSGLVATSTSTTFRPFYVYTMSVGTDGDPAPHEAPSGATITFDGPSVSTINGTQNTALPSPTPDPAMNTRFTVTGGTATYSLQSGTLPAGVTIDPNTGNLVGTPTESGTFANIVVRGTV